MHNPQSLYQKIQTFLIILLSWIENCRSIRNMHYGAKFIFTYLWIQSITLHCNSLVCECIFSACPLPNSIEILIGSLNATGIQCQFIFRIWLCCFLASVLHFNYTQIGENFSFLLKWQIKKSEHAFAPIYNLQLIQIIIKIVLIRNVERVWFGWSVRPFQESTKWRQKKKKNKVA